jgi:hypothetical protein
MPDLPTSQKAMETAPAITAAYGYVIHHHADDERVFYTNWQTPLEVTGLPANLTPSSPQTFTPGQIAHGEITTSAVWEKRSTQIHIPTTDDRLRRYFVTAAAVKITVTILRFNSGKLLDDTPLAFATDGAIIASGVLGVLSFNDQTITGDLTPEPFLADQAVPRHYFERTCNHVLGNPLTCKVNLAAFTHAATITAVNRNTKVVTVDITSPGAADYFRSGTLVLDSTGERMAVVWSDEAGPGDTVRLALRVWNPALAPGEFVTLQAGCKRTTADCKNKFNNAANFGGFPFVPNRNPSIVGV